MSGFAGFGQQNNNTNKPAAGSPFGFGSTPAAGGSTAFSFGGGAASNANASAPTPATGIFGGAPQNTAQPPAAGNGSIGGGGLGGGSLFGNSPQTNASTPNPASNSPFGFGQNAPANSSSTPNASAATLAPPPGGLFGTGNAFGSSGAPVSSTTQPAGSTTPVSKPLFGGFGQSTTPSAPPPATTGTSLFGPPRSATGGGFASSASGTTSPTGGISSGGSLFGNLQQANTQPPANGGGLFGAKPAETTAPVPATPAPAGGLFGISSAAAGTTTPTGPPPASGGLFSFAPRPAEPPAATSAAPTPSLFSAAPPAAAPGAPTPSLFSAAPPVAALPSTPATVNATARSLFSFGAQPAVPSTTTTNVAPTAPPASAAPATGSMFGFGAKPAAPAANGVTADAAKAPASGSLFGLSVQSDKPASSATKAGTISFGGFGGSGTDNPATTAPTFGLPAPTTTSHAEAAKSPVTAEAPKTAPLFGFGSGVSQVAEKTAAPAAVQSTGNLFGSLTAVAPASAPAQPSETTSTGPANLGGGGLFGAKPAEKATSPTASTSLFANPGSSVSVAPASAAAPSLPTTSSNEPAPSLLRGKTFEDIVDGWQKDLDMSVKEFERQAGEVKAWDRVLVSNGNQIAHLHQQVFEAQQSQAGVNQALDYIESQQKQLDQAMSHYEKEIHAMANDRTKPSSAKTPADREREKAYSLAEDLNKQLDDVSRNLSQMIEEVNRLSGPSHMPPAQNGSSTPSASAAEAVSQMPDDPINQLSAILGAHLRALNNIDGNAERLEGKLSDLEKRMGGGNERRGGYGLARR